MNIKDFKKGQSVYILNMHRGRNIEPTILEDTVVSVGRKYVTVTRSGRYESSDDSYSLIENTDCGERTYLCQSMKYAQMYIERENLQLWICRNATFGKEYTLEQLRKVKEILELYENTGLIPEEIIDGKLLTGWIPVEERMPDEGEEVLVTREWRGEYIVEVDEYDIDLGWFSGAGDEIIAWMPFPESYKPEK